MAKVFKPLWQAEGKGAKVLRIVGGKYIRNLDPFLMLDYAKVKLPVGFPDHPHRGFETVSYVLQGKFYHQDSKGHRGIRNAGDVQWMTAGKGIIHSEMPGSFQEQSIGFQLWINLQRKNKLIEPVYQEFNKDQIKIVKRDKAEVKIIAGKWQDQVGPVQTRTPAYYFDVRLEKEGDFQIPVPKGWNTVVFTYEGEISYQQKYDIPLESACQLERSQEKEVLHKFKSSKGGKFVLIGGQPLNEPIAQHGPFVMSTKAELEQAFEDYHEGRNGFEGAKQWSSKIQNLPKGIKYQEMFQN